MNVYKMNDFDWVAHYSEEQAKEYYADLTGTDMADIEEEFGGSVSLNTEVYWLAEDVDAITTDHNFEREEYSCFGDCYRVTYSWAIENNPSLFPGIIATTEY